MSFTYSKRKHQRRYSEKKEVREQASHYTRCWEQMSLCQLKKHIKKQFPNYPCAVISRVAKRVHSGELPSRTALCLLRESDSMNE